MRNVTAPDPSRWTSSASRRRAHDDARRLRAHGLQDPVDDRIEHARVGHDAEEQDGEDEHADDRREALDAGDDELARVPAEPADQRRSDGNEDERHQRRHPFRHDDGQQKGDGDEAQKRQHSSVPFPAQPSSLRGCLARRHAAKGTIRQLNLFDISNKTDLMDVSLRQVRSFLTVARVKSFTGAASILNVTQPALTMQIRRLEEALGVTLVRPRHALGRTDPGRARSHSRVRADASGFRRGARAARATLRPRSAESSGWLRCRRSRRGFCPTQS